MYRYLMFCDGGSRNNPGESASGYAIYKLPIEKEINIKKIEEVLNASSSEYLLVKKGVYIGIKTNNEAEYLSLFYGIKELLNIEENILKSETNYEISVYMDSNLVVNQIQGLWKIKESRLAELANKILSLTKNLNINYTHILRKFNSIADAEVNKVLDSR